MPKILFSFALFPFFAFGLPQCGDENAEWYSCKTNSDCVVITDLCGWPTAAANIKLSKKARERNLCLGSVMDCAEYRAERDGIFVARCVKKKCVAIKTQ